ncbi:MAG: hypothetical protein U1E39_01550 [Planctomycetota bacterium]
MRRWSSLVFVAVGLAAPLAFGGGEETPPQEPPKEAPKEAPKDAPKDAAKDAPKPDAPKTPPVAPTPEQVAAWTARLKTLAGSYRSLDRVDTLARFAPAMCRPVGGGPRVPMSTSEDEATHGRKLYALWSLDVEAYGAVTGLPFRAREPEKTKATPGVDGCSQVMVKEAFEAVEMKDDERGVTLPSGLRPAVRDGKRFKPGAATGLFVMFRLDATTPATDDGWVYGTVDPKGEVTEVGRIASCMKCHVEATGGRLFGLPPD